MKAPKNSQPYYNSVEILFTSVSEMSEIDLLPLLEKALKKIALNGTIDIESIVSEAGDPSDLL